MNNQKPNGPSDKTILASGIILCGLLLTNLVLPADSAVDIFSTAALGVGVALSVATGIEALSGARALIRADILMLWVLYALTLLEFLFPQPRVDEVVLSAAAISATHAVFLGFAGLVIGRHLLPRRNALIQRSVQRPIVFPAHDVFWLFLLTALVGHFYILLSVNFDVIEIFRQLSLPRFHQSWSRGRYGDIYSVLHELGLLINLLPPIAGLMLARKNEFNIFQKSIVAFILLFVFYFAFASGTRSVIVSQLVTFGGAYFLTKPRISMKQILILGAPIAVIAFGATLYMLEFRTVGLDNFAFDDRQYQTLFIDQNIVAISQLIQIFPDTVHFLGLEVPFNALIRPIPRFLWPGKPEGLSTSIEDAMGVVGGAMTISCTFVGEAYIAGGFLAVVLAGLLFGSGAEAWNRLGRDVRSPLRQLLYASGLVCAAFAMRSMLGMVPMIIPPIALWLYIRYRFPRAAQRGPSKNH